MQDALINPTTESLRRFIRAVLPMESDLDAFCQEYFGQVRNRYSVKNSYEERLVILLDFVGKKEIVDALKKYDPLHAEENQPILVADIRSAESEPTGETEKIISDPTEESLREFIFSATRNEQLFEEIIIDYFPVVRREFGSGQKWRHKVNILIDEIPAQQIISAIKSKRPKDYKEHRKLLKPKVITAPRRFALIAAIAAFIATHWSEIRQRLSNVWEWVVAQFGDRPVVVGGAAVGTVAVLSIAGFTVMWGRNPSSPPVEKPPGSFAEAPVALPQAKPPTPPPAPVPDSLTTPTQPKAHWVNAIPVSGIKKLRRVYGASASEVWAAGDPSVVLRFDGRRWARVPGEIRGALPGVFASTGEAWAAGDSGILHFDGNTWAYEVIPMASMLRAVWGSGPADLWAVGKTGTIVHRQRQTGVWSNEIQITDNNLVSIWGSSPSNVWVVGFRGTLLHYDGKEWLAVESGTKRNLYAIWGNSPSDVWVVGQAGTLLHFDGNMWSALDRGAVGITTELNGVWGSARDDIWAVGDQGLILHFNGESWNNMADGSVRVALNDIWGASRSDVWAVGVGGVMMHLGGPVGDLSQPETMAAFPSLSLLAPDGGTTLASSAPVPELGKEVLKNSPPIAEKNENSQTLVIKQAQQEFLAGHFSKAVELARVAQKSNQAIPFTWLIIGNSGCNMRNAELAQEAYQHLDARSRGIVASTCLRNKIQYANGKFYKLN